MNTGNHLNDSTGAAPASIPDTDLFALYANSHAVYITPRGVARVSVALTGLQTVLAALHQRELDAVIEADNGLTFGADVAAGLLCAAASCGALVAEVTNGRHQSATVFMPGSKAEGLMTAAVQEATKAARQPDKPPRNRATGQAGGE